ncbi:TRAP transporter substrate-binding protein DctP [Salinispirillum sp. LH 10-3-1]|uniref:TRAP transporter substrate-binding protein DctP n=1 Tax=Salinispirillum sp. LH 10-3-1 TaxID=2952525 RepID=A0AB38YCP8_9GAMM
MIHRLCLGVSALLLATSLSAMELKISTLYPDGTAEVNALKRASTLIQQETNGRVSIRVYPGGVMGDDQAVERRIRIGQLHGALVQTGALSNVFPDVQVLNAPFAFSNYDEVDYVRAELDQDIADALRERQYHTFGFVDGGFAYVMSKSPVASVDDLKRQKLWLPANDRFSEQVARSFGISPIILGISEVLTSLQTGTVDAIIGPPAAALTLQWFSRVDYLTDMPLIYTVGTLYIHDRHFSRLSADDQAVVTRILNDAFKELDRNSRQNNRRAYEALLNQNIREVNLSPDQVESIRANADQAYQILVNSGEFSQEWLDRFLATLAAYRQEQM